jgi:threonine dehydratase
VPPSVAASIVAVAFVAVGGGAFIAGVRRLLAARRAR